MNKEEIALRLTELYGKFHNITTCNETRFTDIYNIMLENIKYENNSKEQIEEYQKALDEIVIKINDLQSRIDKAIEYLEKSKLNQLDTYCKYLYIDFDTGKIENINELLKILKGEE